MHHQPLNEKRAEKTVYGDDLIVKKDIFDTGMAELYDLVCVFDHNGQITHARGEGWHILGLRAEDLILMNAFEVFALEERHFTVATDIPFRLTSYRMLLDAEIHFEHTIMPSSGNKEFYCLTRDVTQERNRRNELKEKITTQGRTISTLTERDTNKSKILSVLAHDLRNPIASMYSLAQLIEGGDIDSNIKDAVKMMRNQFISANELIANMLEWAFRSFNNNADPFKTAIDLFTITEKCIISLKHLADLKSIRIINNISDDLFARADADHISIVIRNVLQNAIKFTSTNGSINIKGEKESEKCIVYIADNGVGMTTEQVESLNKGISLSSYGTAGEKGFGMGLLLCKEYLDLNNGKLHIDSKEHKGTTIKITLPRS